MITRKTARVLFITYLVATPELLRSVRPLGGSNEQSAGVSQDDDSASSVAREELLERRSEDAYARKASSTKTANVAAAWEKLFASSPVEKAEALSSIFQLDEAEEQHQVAQRQSTEVTDKSKTVCTNYEITCPAMMGNGEVNQAKPVSWHIIRSSDWFKNAVDAAVLASAVLLMFTGPFGLAVGVLGGVTYTSVRALYEDGKPYCKYIKFLKQHTSGGVSWNRMTASSDKFIKLQDLNLAMVVDFVEQAVKTPDDEAHALKNDIISNGQAMFACNVLMYENDQWEARMGRSGFFTEGELADLNTDRLDEYEESEMAQYRSLMELRRSVSTHNSTANKEKDPVLEEIDALRGQIADLRAEFKDMKSKQSSGPGGQGKKDINNIEWVRRERAYIEALINDNPPKHAALRYCRYILCKKANSLAKKMF